MTSSFHRSDNADVYQQNASFVYSEKYTTPVLKLLDPQPGDRVLDVGCGNGILTLQIAQIVGQPHPRTGRRGFVLGIDLSQDMISKACIARDQTGLTVAEVDFQTVDGYKLDEHLEMHGLNATFDRVFSNAALHWISETPDLVMRNIHKALREEGTLALEMGGYLNMIGVRMALHRAMKRRGVDPLEVDPWYFPSPEAYSKVVEAASSVSPFTIVSAELVPRITPLPGPGLRGWLQTFAGPFMNALDSENERNLAADDVVEDCRPDMFDPASGTWSCMYVRLRLKAVKGRDQGPEADTSSRAQEQ
ncbi:hypothetical protein OC861_000173 [Tilletia horrida]|nr:hypothetical protein OC845_000170 [Tilletia horrida]KAK0570223.1 hypothetical protein OC861_000173 [Tilletia horrida]